MTKLKYFLPFIFFFISSVIIAGELYKWIDNNGKTHYGEKLPEGETAEKITNRLTPMDATDVTLAPGKVTLYSAQWCGYCKSARHYFKVKNIPFVEYDIEKSRAANSEYRALGGGGLPLIAMGKDTMNGFSRKAFDRFYQNNQ